MVGASNFSVNLIGGGLVVLGVALLVATLAFWRAATEDPEVLAPLEVMADRRFARADHERRAALLNSVRPVSDESGETIREVQRESHREAVRRARHARTQDTHEEAPAPDLRPAPEPEPVHRYEPEPEPSRAYEPEPEPEHRFEPQPEPEPSGPAPGMIDPLLNFQNQRPQN